ncbi:lipopolysaccharide heptosyltransferase II [Herminiimonas sp. CN]|uniref:lipopolysaccharide heptosyltransferase II n=1 Tax=Herminiimonas sp. CN TaxID=1349818 RepID=UPI000A76F9FB|nr:lipopolysaccharide heptosyltransferase II [Herminiimonas sp. CN]
MTTLGNSIARTLVISPNWIGDAVMAQPLLQLLRQQNPHQPIDVLAPTWVAPVWRAMREVDTVLESPFKHGALQLQERRAFASMLKLRGYARAYVLPNTLKFALIPWLARIPQRIGYRGEMRYGLLNVIHRDDRKAPRPMVSFYAALAASPAHSVPDPSALPRPTLSVTDLQIQQAIARTGLQQNLPLLVFAPGAEFGSAKRWPIGHFAQLAQTIQQRHPDTQIALLGSTKDQPICEQIVALAPKVISLAGVTTLNEAIALIAYADAMVSNDSGLLHIASALNRPVVALYGPTDPDHAPPFSDLAQSLSLQLDCAPCRQRECPLGHHNCMQNLTPEMVWKPLRAMITR